MSVIEQATNPLPDYNGKNRCVLNISVAIIAVCSIALSFSFLNESTLHLHITVTEVYAQHDVETVKHRDLTIDLGDGLKTNAQLTIPAVGKGPFPGVLLIPGAGPNDMNYTAGANVKPFWQIAQYLSERGFVVLRYDKRGIGEDGAIINNSIWGNMTYEDLKQDAVNAVNVLIQQPEVNPKKISLIGHSEGGEIATRVAIDNSDKVKNLLLMDARIQTPYDALYYGVVGLPLEYTRQVLDKIHNGSFSLEDASQDQVFQNMVGGNTSLFLNQSLHNGTKVLKSVYNPNNDKYININSELKPILETRLENAFEAPKCERTELPCSVYLKSILSLKPTLSIIGNVSNSTGILILHGQNDSGSRVQQAFLLQQRLTELNHSDHTLITYPDLGHVLYPSSEWVTSFGPIPEYVLQDMFEWLASPARDVSEEIQ
jgi:pimeloyl-ACP methyl ester carboxylesterase